MKIIWLNFANSMLTDIYDYHAKVATKNVAKNLIKSLIH